MSTDAWDFFEKHEFECKCGCGTNNISNTLVNMLDVARRIAGVPFKITSGVRCPTHNKAVGGVTDSSHVGGWAVDIQAKDSAARYKVLFALRDVGFKRIGLAHTFIHVDIDPAKAEEVIWDYY